MRVIKNKKLAQLLMQTKFAPEGQRRKQLDAAERLIWLIDKSRGYPFEFVCFHITGYRPKGPAAQELIEGSELADDLRVFIVKLSGQLALFVAEQEEEIYTAEELAEKFAVSTKTIERWRRRGLVAKKFVLAEGKKRLGFSQSAVDRFVNENAGLLGKAKRFARLTDGEKQMIIEQAGALAAKTGLSRRQIIMQIADQLGRAAETVRYTIINYQKNNPKKLIFDKPGGVVGPEQGALVYKMFKDGADVGELMREFGRSKSSIYRIINQQKARELLAEKIEFVASDEFFRLQAKETILAKPVATKTASAAVLQQSVELSQDSLPRYLRAIKDTPSLNRTREMELFCRYNYLKYLAWAARSQIKLSGVLSRRLKEVEKHLAEAEAIKEVIVEANLRLVVSVASKHSGGAASFADLIRQGSSALVEAVEKFDYTRGFRFGSYAAWAIAKSYAREMPGEAQLVEADVRSDLKTAAVSVIASGDKDLSRVERVIRDNLDEQEQYIIRYHFGLVGTGVKKKSKTLKELGDELGLSGKKVRRIELLALQKLRHSLTTEEFEQLTS